MPTRYRAGEGIGELRHVVVRDLLVELVGNPLAEAIPIELPVPPWRAQHSQTDDDTARLRFAHRMRPTREQRNERRDTSQPAHAPVYRVGVQARPPNVLEPAALWAPARAGAPVRRYCHDAEPLRA
jgi:hypothetical protein